MNVPVPTHPEAQGGQAARPTTAPTRSITTAGMSGKRFECSAPGCGRHFTRKEHLVRHAKSHSSQPKHQCPICGRRYVRSDVLKRHIEFHPQQSRSRRALVACVFCHKRKLKCDEITPCQSCISNGIGCVRPDMSPNSGGNDTLTTTDAARPADLDAGMADAGNDGNNYSIDILSSAWSDANDEHQALNVQPSQYGWLVSPLSPPDSTSALVSPSQALVQWPVLADAPIPQTPAPSAAGFVDCPLPLGSAGSGPGERSSGMAGGYPVQSVNPTVNATLLPSTLLAVAEHGGISEISTIASNKDASLLQATSSGQSRSEAASRHPTTPLSPGREHGHSNQALRTLIRQDLAKAHDLVQIFFVEVHPYWPILHAPTFELRDASDLLLGAMLLLSSWVAGRHDYPEIASTVLEEVMAATGPESTPSLHTLQALLLCIVYAVCCRSEQGMLAKAVRLNALLVSTCRCLDIFNGHHVLPDYVEECAFTFWLAKEQLHRLAFSVLRIDTYLSILLDHPPSVRYQELCIPLPKSSQLWTSASEEERRKLQWDEPVGREKALFSYLIRDALVDNGSGSSGPCQLPCRLTRLDYHLGLCALQAGVWEAAREAHSAASDEIVTKLAPGATIKVWRSNLKGWYAKMVEDCDLDERHLPTGPARTSPTSNGDSALTPLTITLWHISAIKMHAPLTLLRVHGNLFHGSNALNPAAIAAMAAVQKPKARLRTWMSSACPRTALWSASQIARLVAVDPEASINPVSRLSGTSSPVASRRLRLSNPLAIPGLLMSAIVACSYASHTSVCPSCSPPGSVNAAAIDLFTAEYNNPELLRWKERGEGWAVWGRSRIPVCRCRLEALGEWFLRALPEDHDAQSELESFLKGLDA
ncbi:hypothetical protein MFIFM68171_01784 [Madurella fahalii]|uniref:Uncharacterized protein n=1 Tax=Madurella fahalii TaxID=1157608 RepID=A0ABQ0G1F3_9PEZI